MSYDADFAGPALDGTPVDQVIFGAEPAFWGFVLLVVLLAAVLGWWMGRSGARRSGGDAAERIWDDIHDAIKAAMKANSHDLPGKAARLREVIDGRLGQTLRLSNAVATPLEAMIRALDGRPAAAAHAGSSEAHDGHEPAEPPTTASTVITIVTPGEHGGSGSRGAHEPDAGETHAPRSLSPRERSAALRGALDDLHDHWSVRRARVAEMRAAWDELSGAGLPNERRPRLSHDH